MFKRTFFFFIFVLICLFVSPAQAASQEFGIVGAVPSLGSDSSKQQAVDAIADLGMGWMRHEFGYQDPIDFTHYDAANAKAKARGIKTLGLLLYPGSDKSHDQWKIYVQAIVSHFGGDITAWEIMNEPDNYLSGGDYVAYLNEARDIIRNLNPSATIVLGGITSRPETPNFWNAVAAAGGWDSFDVVGLHIYHSGNPEKVNFGGGDLLAEYDRALSAIRKHGIKKIWITETGYKASEVGNENQANWLARTLAMSRSVPAIEKIFIYRLFDDNRATYGLMGADLNHRPAYDRIKDVVSHLSGAGIGTRLYPQDKKILDDLESSTGWQTDATLNGALSLSTADGKNGKALKFSYTFSADKAYAVAEKNIPIEGQPQALAAWIYGDDTNNVWKYRFKDAKGETFQADLGLIGSGWTYKQFTIGQDTAFVSWDGDNKVDYPISFNAIVVDRQSGDTSGTGMIDDITAITGGADLFSFQFGSMIAYWKTIGSSSATLCGASRDFNETPQYANDVNCGDTPKTNSVATTQKATSPAPAASSSPAAIIDKSKSIFRIDGSNVLADGQASYRLVMLLKDSAGTIIKNQKPSVTVSGKADTVKLSSPFLVGDEWWATIASTEAGERTLQVKVGGSEIYSGKITFIPVDNSSPSPSPLPTPSTSPSPRPSPVPVATPKNKPTPLITVLTVLVLVSTGFGIWWFKFRRKKQQPKA